MRGWIQFAPVRVERLPGRIVVDAVVVHAELESDGSTAGFPVEPARGEPVTLSLDHGGTDGRGTDGGGIDEGEVGAGRVWRELADLLERGEVLQMLRDEVGTVVVVRNGDGWWFLEVERR